MYFLGTAPIPRTLQMSLIGVRTISQLNTAPAQRHPIQTYVMEKRGRVIKEIIQENSHVLDKSFIYTTIFLKFIK